MLTIAYETGYNPLRVLSVQSSVVSGTVGNVCAVFALTALGVEVCPLATATLSMHTGFRRVSPVAPALDGPTAATVLAALEEAGELSRLTHVLTGYCRDADALREVLAATVRSGASLVVDPVLGDRGVLYVPPPLVDVYRYEVAPRARLLTPNAFELELLSGVRLVGARSFSTAADILHTRGTRAVVVTSCTAVPATEDGCPRLALLVSCTRDMVAEDGELVSAVATTEAEGVTCTQVRFAIAFPCLPGGFSGAGDLFAATLLARWAARPRALAGAARSALASVHAVCQRTAARNVALTAALAAERKAAATAVSTDGGVAHLRTTSWLEAAAGAVKPGATEVPAFCELQLRVADFTQPPDEFLFAVQTVEAVLPSDDVCG